MNTTLSIFITAPSYNFGTRSIGFFYFTPVIAAILERSWDAGCTTG